MRQKHDHRLQNITQHVEIAGRNLKGCLTLVSVANQVTGGGGVVLSNTHSLSKRSLPVYKLQSFNLHVENLVFCSNEQGKE